MTYRGHIRNGQIVLDEPAELPEGAVVAVQLMPTPADSQEETLVDELSEFVGKLELPADFAAQHDHYIHGTPKR